MTKEKTTTLQTKIRRLWITIIVLSAIIVLGIVSMVVYKANELPPRPHNAIADSTYVGLSVDDAKRKAESEGKAWRIVDGEGKSGILTFDYRTDRINFVVRFGKIAAADRY